MYRFATIGVATLLLAVVGTAFAVEPAAPAAAPPSPPTAGYGPMRVERGCVMADAGGDGEFNMRMPGPHGDMMWLGGAGEMGGMMKMMHALASLDLTPEQNKQREQLMLAHRKEAIALSSQMQTADVEIDELLLADPVALDKVKAKVKEKHDAAAKLELSHIQLMQDVKKLLTPEQRKSLEAAMLEMRAHPRAIMGGPSMMAPPPPPN